MSFPQRRMRRLRSNNAIRSLLKETTLTPNDFIMPLFLVEGSGICEEISAMPGQFHYSIDMLSGIIKDICQAGIKAVLLFGSTSAKDPAGSSAWNDSGITQQGIRTVRELAPELLIITDTCLCAYTDHGHCGVITGQDIDNDISLENLSKTALSHAAAGADFVAPSDMMDGRILAIRESLDEAGYQNTGIISYSTKFASAFYGPFREAADSAPQFGDRRSYQMQPANSREALQESLLDEEEGADMLMVKPALAYLDIIKEIKNNTLLPLVCYNVSGEYSMVKAAAQNGWIDEKSVVLETLLGMKRAGADLIITYHALDAARWIKEEV